MERYIRDRPEVEEPAIEGRVAWVVCGHARGLEPVRVGNLWMIDTGAAYVSSMVDSRFTIARIHPGPLELFEYPT